MIRRYSELRRLDNFEDRYEYLRLRGSVGRETFGPDRYLNQMFYTSREWRQVRNHVIARDSASDLGLPGYEIYKGLYIHHMNPMTVEDIVQGNDAILDPEFLITVTHSTHNAIHFGVAVNMVDPLKERLPGDTKLW